jgi:hypothetical protein
MYQEKHGPFARRASLLILFVASVSATTAMAQCVDSSAVNDYRVRLVQVETLFGRVPKKLRETLESHRGEPYSSSRASAYIQEIKKFYASDPAQEKYERLIANKLRLSVKAGRTSLKCVDKLKPTECQLAFPGTTQCVDVTLRRYFVDVDVLDASPYIVPLPRSALVALYGAMPQPLMALNPGFAAEGDKRFGPAFSIDTATDLLDLKQIFAGPSPAPVSSPIPVSTPAPTPRSSPSDPDANFDFTPTGASGGSGGSGTGDKEPALELPKKDTKLLARIRGRKSLTEAFYDTSSGIAFTRTNALSKIQNLALEAKLDAKNVPQGSGDYLANAGKLTFSTEFHSNSGAIKLLEVAGGYRWSRNRFFSGNASVPNVFSTENGFEGRAIADGLLGKGLMRAAIWFDGGSLDRNRGSYQRAAFLFGYAKDFAIPRKKDFHLINPSDLSEPCWTSYPDLKQPKDPNKKPVSRKNEQTVGFEMTLGAGHVWGSTPEYARFYGGSPAGQFLYDELSAQSITAFPAGPIIRSLPQGQAGVATSASNLDSGGTSYWHANVSVSIPIAAWSSPLIPFEWVSASAKKSKPPTGVDDRRDEDKESDGHVPDVPGGAIICRDLKSTIKTLVGVSGVTLLVAQEARDLLTDDEKKALRFPNDPNATPEQLASAALAQQRYDELRDKIRPTVKTMFDQEILPITNFIADHANIIAVKPLVMFDVAHLALQGTGANTRYGVGSGLQIDVVMARFELGYMAALNRMPGDPRGSFVGRLVLRRFF